MKEIYEFIKAEKFLTAYGVDISLSATTIKAGIGKTMRTFKAFDSFYTWYEGFKNGVMAE